MTQLTEVPGPGLENADGSWDPIFGQRVFRSARQAWMIYGKYRFSVSERNFYNYVGSGKACPPREDDKFYVEDIELVAKAQAWPLAFAFVRGAQKGGEGEGRTEDLDLNIRIQEEKLKKLQIETESAEIDLAKKRKELLPRSEYEQRLAAAAAVVGIEAETFVYDKVREIIHVCSGEPEKENSLREYLLKEVRTWLHSFSRAADYDVALIEDEADVSEGGEDGTGNIG